MKIGWRKVIVAALIVGVGVAMEVCTKNGLTAHMLELLKWVAVAYLGANALKGGLEGLKK